MDGTKNFRYCVATLVGRHKIYSTKDFIEHLERVTVQPEVIVVSSIPEIHEIFFRYQKNIPVVGITGDHDEGRNRIVDTTSARESLRQYIIKNNYEWSLWLDNDILVPSNITEKFLSYLRNNPEVKMVHSYHPARQYGEELRHGIGSSFIHKDLLEAYPFTYAEIKGHYLGDDQIWLLVINQLTSIYYPRSIIRGTLFDLKHKREDGTVASLSDKYRDQLL